MPVSRSVLRHRRLDLTGALLAARQAVAVTDPLAEIPLVSRPAPARVLAAAAGYALFFLMSIAMQNALRYTAFRVRPGTAAPGGHHRRRGGRHAGGDGAPAANRDG